MIETGININAKIVYGEPGLVLIIIVCYPGVKGVRKMTIGEYLKRNDIDTYRKLMKIGRQQKIKKKEIRLGDKPENLMKHDSYKRQGRRVRQTKWG